MTDLSEKVKQGASAADAGWGKAYTLFTRVIADNDLHVGAEVGVAYGGHSEAILELSCVEKLYGVDPYEHMTGYDDPMNLPQDEFDEVRRFTLERLARFGERYEHLRMKSSDAAKVVPGDLDFVYVDADHSYEGSRRDLGLWFRKVRDGGVIGGHDYGHVNLPGVKRAVDEFFSRFGWEIHEEGEGVWWIRKKSLNVSFIVPAYNCEKTVEESIGSILDGNFRDGDEVVVTDDGSTDGTGAVLRKIAERHPGMIFKLIRHTVNRGGGAARNTCVMNSANGCIFCLDSDNILAPGSVAKLLDFLIKTGADVAAFAEIRFFKDTPGQIADSWLLERECRFEHCVSSYRVPPASGNYLFTKASWIKAGGYPEFAGALDAWGFGLRQVAGGARMLTLEGSYYLHRQGRDSYYARDFRSSSMSLKALQLLVPYFDRLTESSIRRITSRKGRHSFLEVIDQRPLLVKSGAQSFGGIFRRLFHRG